MKTSTRLSLQFTALSFLLTFFFALLVNGFFFRSWYSHELQGTKREILMHTKAAGGANPGQNKVGRPERQQGFARSILIESSTLEDRDVHTYRLFPHIASIDNKRVFIGELPRQDKLILTDITPLMERQISLLTLSALLLVLIVLLAYIISRHFVRHALRDISTIAEYVAGVEVSQLKQNIALDHLPDNDEIKTIALAINQMTNKLHGEIDQIQRFVAHVSHEFKTPLMVMSAQAEVAFKAQQYKQGLTHTLEQVDHMNRLLDSLLQLTNSQNGQHTKPEVFLLKPLIDGIVDSTNSVYSEKDITIIVMLNNQLTLTTHRGSAEMIFRNLIDNALKYTPAGGSVSIQGDSSSVTIADTGVGIAQEALEHIWEPFWQADTSKGIDQGFGLGLALVKELVDSLGWVISVDSSEGQGTTFTLIFGA